MKKTYLPILLVLLISLFWYCATQRPPSGGPVDKTAPQILDVYPSSGSTQVPREVQLMVEFSERVDKKSVEQAIFISPGRSEELSYKWKGRKLFVKFPDSLHQNKTYVLTIGTDAMDLRKNRLENSFQLAFSTGDKLDQGQISGTDYSQEGIEGTIVGAYTKLPNIEPDPAAEFAEYVTQCNATGQYQLSYISPGNYRIFALFDKDKNKKYNHGSDAIGIPTTDVTITDDSLQIANINFKIAVKDTILPGVKSVMDIDQFHIDVRFNEAIAPIDFKNLQNRFIIVDEKTKQDTLPILSIYQNALDSSRFHLKTEVQRPDSSYVLFALALSDLAGNLLDSSLCSYTFTGSSIPDTIKPKLINQSIADKAKNIPLNPILRFTFSEALLCSTLEKYFSLTDSNKIAIAGQSYWLNPSDFSFTPIEELKSEMKYLIHIEVDSVVDEFGNPLADSSIDFIFTTLNKDTLSALSGTIYDKKAGAQGKIFLTANLAGNQNVAYHTVSDSAGLFNFDNILPGIYLINGFCDSDRNGSYSYGNVNPFIPAERFFFYPDSIKIRSRWPNEGNNIILNRY